MTDQIDKIYKMIQKDQEKMKRILDPYTEQKRFYEDLYKNSPKYLTIKYINDFIDRKNVNEKVWRNQTYNKDYLSEIIEIEKNISGLVLIQNELPALKTNPYFDSIMKSRENILKYENQYASVDPPSLQIESALSIAEATVRHLNVDQTYSYLMLSSVSKYQDFLEKQYKSIENLPKLISDQKIQIAKLSGSILEHTVASIEFGATMWPSIAENIENFNDDIFNKSNSYSHIERSFEYVYTVDFTGNIETIYKDLLPVKLNQLGFKIVKIICDINQFYERDGKEPVFKPTTKICEACAKIPAIVADDKNNFFDIVDLLYHLIYEGSGSAKRLTNLNINDSLAPLWDLKFIRNDGRHDLDHGKGSDSKKKLKYIGDIYKELIQKPMPITDEDWSTAQFGLYEKLFVMLSIAFNQIQKDSSDLG